MTIYTMIKMASSRYSLVHAAAIGHLVVPVSKEKFPTERQIGKGATMRAWEELRLRLDHCSPK
jgi:hypothetical protein